MKKLFSPKLNLDWRIALLTIGSTMLLSLNYYHPDLVPWDKLIIRGKPFSSGWLGLSPLYLDKLLLYLVVPLLFVLLIFRESPREYGFSLGDWRLGLFFTVSGILLIAPILWLVVHTDSSMQEYYKSQLTGLPWNTFTDLLGWEFFFRGWLLFGYGKKFGPEAIWIQAVPFALAHLGKPEVETLSTILGGFLFGWVAWKTRSFLYPFLIHWFVASFTILIAAGIIH